MKVRIALVCLALAACSDWPDTGSAPKTKAGQPWPSLLPVSEIVADTPASADETSAADMASRAAALRARAALLRRSADTLAEMEALRARLDR